MTTEETELTFVRCPNCRSLVPAVASRCRMCGHHFEVEASEEAGEQGSQKKSRVRQRTISVSKQDMLNASPEEEMEDPQHEVGGEVPFAFGKGFGESFDFGAGQDLLHEPEELDDELPVGEAFDEPEEIEEEVHAEADEELIEEEPAEVVPASGRGMRAFERDEEDERPVGLRFGKGSSDDQLGAETGFGEDEFDAEGDDDDDGGDVAEDANVPRKKRRRRRRRRGGSDTAQAGVNEPRNERPADESNRQTPNWGGEPSRTESVRAEAPRQEPVRMETPRTESPRMESPRADFDRGDSLKSEPVRPEAVRTEPVRTELMRGETMGTQESGFDDEKVGRGQQMGGAKGKTPRRDEHGTLLGWMVNYSTDSKGIAIELRGGRYFVGRQRLRDDDLVIADSSISTPHCLLFVSRSEGLRVQDLMSEHGTYVKKRGSETYNQVHDTVEVQHGDWIRFGTYEVAVCLVP